MKTNDIHRKMLSVSKNLLTEHNLDFSWYINDYRGVSGYLHNAKLPNLIVSVYLTDKVIEMCGVKILTNDLQYEYACELLKEFKVKIQTVIKAESEEILKNKINEFLLKEFGTDKIKIDIL